MKPIKLRVGQRVVCTHYKDRPVVKVELIQGDEVWVLETRSFKDGNFYTKSWWGPRNWFKALPKKRKGLTKSGLCDSNIPGCTCNQSANIGR